MVCAIVVAAAAAVGVVTFSDS
eukprot:COSAG02_NODE_39899_length_411_cov_0.942308_1_plen_21_part_10